jgi:hypothetical protein
LLRTFISGLKKKRKHKDLVWWWSRNRKEDLKEYIEEIGNYGEYLRGGMQKQMVRKARLREPFINRIPLPFGSALLHVEMGQKYPMLYVLENLEEDRVETRTIWIVSTSEEITAGPMNYIGSYSKDNLTYHVFEVL